MAGVGSRTIQDLGGWRSLALEKPLAKTPFALSSTPKSEVHASKSHSDCHIP